MRLRDFNLQGYITDKLSGKIENNFIETNCYSEFIGCSDYILSSEDIKQLFSKYKIDRVYYAYIMNLGIDIGDTIGICEYQRKPYFMIDGKIYTPIKYESIWYLMESDSYLTEEITESILKSETDKDFVYCAEDGVRIVGMLFIDPYNINEKKINEKLLGMQKKISFKFLDTVGEFGNFLIEGLNVERT